MNYLTLINKYASLITINPDKITIINKIFITQKLILIIENPYYSYGFILHDTFCQSPTGFKYKALK